MPDLWRSNAVFYVSPYKVDRTVPDRRKYALTDEEQTFLDEEELGYCKMVHSLHQLWAFVYCKMVPKPSSLRLSNV